MNHNITPEQIFEIVAPLNPILSDNEIWEIMIDGHERILVDRHSQLTQVDSPFATEADLQNMIERLFALYGITLNAANPVGYLRLPDHSRVMAVLPPNAVNGPYMVMRRVVGPKLSWEKLIEFNAVSQSVFELLKGAVDARKNILVAGGTGSGKTTIANLIAELAPPDERLIVVEEDYEMQVEHPRLVRLTAGGPGELSFASALTAATRMRPDRLIVGNLNGPIAAAVLQAFGTGIDGSLSNIHATGVQDALNRLESFCLMANLGLGLSEIRLLVTAGIQLICYQERLLNGRRRLLEIVELQGVENHRYVLQPLMRYNEEADTFERTQVKASWEA